MKPVALFKFMKDVMSTCDQGSSFLVPEGRDNFAYLFLHVVHTVIRWTRIFSMDARISFLTTFFVIFMKRFKNLRFEIPLGMKCLCCGDQMVFEFGHGDVRKRCGNGNVKNACKYYDVEKKTCERPSEHDCQLRFPDDKMASKNAWVVSTLATFILMNVKLHGYCIANVDPDCKFAFCVLLLRFKNFEYYVTDDEKTMLISPSMLFKKHVRFKKNGLIFNQYEKHFEEMKELFGVMVGRSKFTFLIPSFLDSVASRVTDLH